MDGLSKEDIFHLNEEIDRFDTSVLDYLVDVETAADDGVELGGIDDE